MTHRLFGEMSIEQGGLQANGIGHLQQGRPLRPAGCASAGWMLVDDLLMRLAAMLLQHLGRYFVFFFRSAAFQ